MVYYATKQILTVLSRLFSILGIDAWRWYNELPLRRIKNRCNLTKESIFNRSIFLSTETDGDDSINSIDVLQDGLKLQDLNTQDLMKKSGKHSCCFNQNCSNWSCDAFWERFNFEHRSAKELSTLRRSFELDF